MMNHSLITADRTTHLKIVVIALVGAILVVAVGIGARISAIDAASTQLEARAPVYKATKSSIVTSRDDLTIR